jgi:cell wall assembly regulator SMI1
MGDRWRAGLRLAGEVWDDETRRAGAAAEAGGPAWAFLPELIPIAGNDSGDQLVVDLRRGPRTGCVKEYFHEDGALHEPVAPSLAALVEDTVCSLRTGTPAVGRRPVVEAGRLDWRAARAQDGAAR